MNTTGKRLGVISEEIRRAIRNVIVCSLDACSAKHFGCHGYSRDTTPQMDKLAGSGVRFSQYFCQYPNTGENFRCTMLSRYPDPNHRGVFPSLDKRGDLLLAEHFQQAGFRTAAFTGNSFWSGAFGHGDGWDRFVWGASPAAVPFFGKMPIMCRADSLRGMAVDWLREHKEEKFLLWTHFLEPHDPYHAPEPWTHMFAGDHPKCPGDELEFELQKMADYDRARQLPDGVTRHYQAAYDGSLAFVDREIGALVAQVGEMGLAENALIVITADHGEGWGQHERYVHNNCVYDEEMNIPLIFILPGAVNRSGVVVDAIAESVDLLPTLLDVAGILPKDLDCDGVSLLPVLAGEAQVVKPFVFGLSGAEVFNKATELSATWSIRTQSHKLIHNALAGTNEFYRVAEDPGETRNVYDSGNPDCRELEEALRRNMAAWYARSESS